MDPFHILSRGAAFANKRANAAATSLFRPSTSNAHASVDSDDDETLSNAGPQVEGALPAQLDFFNVGGASGASDSTQRKRKRQEQPAGWWRPCPLSLDPALFACKSRLVDTCWY